MILALYTVDCFANARNDNWNLVMLSVSETSLRDSKRVFFRQGGQGGYLRSAPRFPLNNPPNPLTPLQCALHLHMS